MIVLKDLVTGSEAVFGSVTEAYSFAGFLVSLGHEVEFVKGAK